MYRKKSAVGVASLRACGMGMMSIQQHCSDPHAPQHAGSCIAPLHHSSTRTHVGQPSRGSSLASVSCVAKNKHVCGIGTPKGLAQALPQPCRSHSRLQVLGVEHTLHLRKLARLLCLSHGYEMCLYMSASGLSALACKASATRWPELGEQASFAASRASEWLLDVQIDYCISTYARCLAVVM